MFMQHKQVAQKVASLVAVLLASSVVIGVALGDHGGHLKTSDAPSHIIGGRADYGGLDDYRYDDWAIYPKDGFGDWAEYPKAKPDFHDIDSGNRVEPKPPKKPKPKKICPYIEGKTFPADCDVIDFGSYTDKPVDFGSY